MNQLLKDRWTLCLLISLLPFIDLLFDIAIGNMGGNPIQALHIRLGDWSLRFLCITLAITPIQVIRQLRGMSAYRQLFGLLSFFYATLHVLAYVAIDHAFVFSMIALDILESRYIWFGVIAYVVILLLAVTSSKRAQRQMGKAWKKLHRCIYPASIAVLLHYFWQLKGNLIQPIFYSLLIGLLLLFRVLVWFKNKKLRQLMIPVGHR
jgi:sulfoxide reductase heme-binding subunit YedZ